jgi:hypothetical protein
LVKVGGGLLALNAESMPVLFMQKRIGEFTYYRRVISELKSSVVILQTSEDEK